MDVLLHNNGTNTLTVARKEFQTLRIKTPTYCNENRKLTNDTYYTLKERLETICQWEQHQILYCMFLNKHGCSSELEELVCRF